MLMRMIILALWMAFTGGCTLAPAEKTSREQSLKTAADGFIQNVTQDNWNEAYAWTDAELSGVDDFKEYLKKTWVPDGILTGGVISSMSWINDDMAKVKINWSFQTGTVPSYSSETFVWNWKNKSWKMKGRVLR